MDFRLDIPSLIRTRQVLWSLRFFTVTVGCFLQTACQTVSTSTPTNPSAGAVMGLYERISRNAANLAMEGDYEGALIVGLVAINGDPNLIRIVDSTLDDIDRQVLTELKRGNYGVAITLNSQALNFIEAVRASSLKEDRVLQPDWMSVTSIRNKHIAFCRTEVAEPLLLLVEWMYNESKSANPHNLMPKKWWQWTLGSGYVIYWLLNDDEVLQQQAYCLNTMTANLLPWMTPQQRKKWMQLESVLKSEAGGKAKDWTSEAAACAKIRLNGEP